MLGLFCAKCISSNAFSASSDSVHTGSCRLTFVALRFVTSDGARSGATTSVVSVTMLELALVLTRLESQPESKLLLATLAGTVRLLLKACCVEDCKQLKGDCPWSVMFPSWK